MHTESRCYAQMHVMHTHSAHAQFQIQHKTQLPDSRGNFLQGEKKERLIPNKSLKGKKFRESGKKKKEEENKSKMLKSKQRGKPGNN